MADKKKLYRLNVQLQNWDFKKHQKGISDDNFLKCNKKILSLRKEIKKLTEIINPQL